ncbi:MAG: TIGR04282 family arsenosugar biosynthesis glycosyltransferase [Dehalococcoidia bacterium]
MKQKTPSNALLVFVRTPHPGKVKTRLARSLGDEKAAEFYRLCTDATIGEIKQLSRVVERYIFFAEPVDTYEMRHLDGLGFNVAVQEGENLGQRLCNAFSRVLENGAQKVVIVASDVPDLSASIMKEAISSLDNSDVVIGPCYDGGYYLIGMKELHEGLFHGIPWGTERVYQQTLDAAKEKGLTVIQLPILIDIDTEADLRQWSEVDGYKKPALLDFIKAMRL